LCQGTVEEEVDVRLSNSRATFAVRLLERPDGAAVKIISCVQPPMAQQPSEKLDFSRQFGRPDKHDIWVRHITMVEKIISPP